MRFGLFLTSIDIWSQTSLHQIICVPTVQLPEHLALIGFLFNFCLDNYHFLE